MIKKYFLKRIKIKTLMTFIKSKRCLSHFLQFSLISYRESKDKIDHRNVFHNLYESLCDCHVSEI